MKKTRRRPRYIEISVLLISILLLSVLFYPKNIPQPYDPKRIDLDSEISQKEHEKIYLDYCREKITRYVINNFDSLNMDNYAAFIGTLEALPANEHHILGTRAWVIAAIYHHFGEDQNALKKYKELYDMNIRTYCYRPVINEKNFVLDLGDILFLNKPEAVLNEMYVHDSMNQKRKAASKAWELLNKYGLFVSGYRNSEVFWSYGQKASSYLAVNKKDIAGYKIKEVSAPDIKEAAEKFAGIIIKGDVNDMIGFFKSGNLDYPYREFGYTTTYSKQEIVFLLKYRKGDIYKWYKECRAWFKNSYSGNFLVTQNDLIKFIGIAAGDQKIIQFGLEKGQYKIFSMGE
jgi:hypothetical protein